MHQFEKSRILLKSNNSGVYSRYAGSEQYLSTENQT